MKKRIPHRSRAVKCTLAILATAGVAPVALPATPTVRNDEIRAMVAEMLSDAQTRSSLLQSGSTAGHDGHFFLASPDGNFKMEISGQVQFRYNLVFRDQGPDSAGAPIDDFTPGFQTRRTKLGFKGHIYSPNLFYHIKGAFGRSGGAFDLEEAEVGYKFDNGLELKWGQFKLPFLREELVSSSRQLTVGRSLTNELFNQDRSQGVQVSYAADAFRLFGAFSNGFNADNKEFNAKPADWAVTGRAEFLFAGSWKQFKDFTSKPGSEDGLMLGLAAHFERSPDTPSGPAIQDRISWTLDASWESDGWSLYGAFIGNHDSGGAASGGSVDEYGWLVQGGLYLADNVETFARFDMIIPDSDLVADSAFSTVTFGANYYIHGHSAKFTADVQLFLDDVVGTDSIAGSEKGIGFLDNGAHAGEYAVRLQFQLLF